MYSYAHPSGRGENSLTRSGTLEFETIDRTTTGCGDIASSDCCSAPAAQIEFSRLNLTYTVMSKRFLKQLVDEGHVDGWDDPRMPTIVGARRRGFTPEGIRLLVERVGVSKSDSFIEWSVLEDCQREVLN